jgi:hypothetical protein
MLTGPTWHDVARTASATRVGRSRLVSDVIDPRPRIPRRCPNRGLGVVQREPLIRPTHPAEPRPWGVFGPQPPYSTTPSAEPRSRGVFRPSPLIRTTLSAERRLGGSFGRAQFDAIGRIAILGVVWPEADLRRPSAEAELFEVVRLETSSSGSSGSAVGRGWR